MKETIHKRNVSGKDPKWVKKAIDNGKAVLVFKREVQDNGYTIVRGKEVELLFTPLFVSNVWSLNSMEVIGDYSYNGETLYRDGERFTIENIPFSYEFTTETREDIRERDIFDGEFGRKRIEVNKGIKFSYSDGSSRTFHLDSECSQWEPIGRKVVSCNYEDEILEETEENYKPSSAFAMGQTFRVTVKKIKRTYVRVFEDGDSDTIVRVLTEDPRD